MNDAAMSLGWKYSDKVPEHPFANEATAAEWENLKNQLPIGSIVTGRVFIQAHFGIFFDAGLGFPVLINVTDFGTKSPMDFPDDYPPLDSIISGKLSGFDDGNRQVRVINPTKASLDPSEQLRYQEEGRLPEHPLISIHPKVRLGYTCLIGTQVSVIDVLDWLADSLSIDSTINAFPGLTEQMIRACLKYASDREKHVRPAGW